MSIRIGIYGHGNLGRGVENAVSLNNDMELKAIFTRRSPEQVKPDTEGVPVYHIDDAAGMKDEIDVMILCGGSATDLPVQTPLLASLFNVVDSFDTHANISDHLRSVNTVASAAGTTAVISVGWDPGMFSLNRLYSSAILPEGQTYTFWGKGVSQGHSDAIRRIDGVIDAKQYTIPVASALSAVRSFENPSFETRDKHTRECYVVAAEGADTRRIEKEIVSMPNYFSNYDTSVHFITQKELDKNHSKMPHGGIVFRSGVTGLHKENKHLIEYSLKLDSNPEFTAGVLVAYARAAFRLSKEGRTGCLTPLDIPPVYLSQKTREEVIQELL